MEKRKISILLFNKCIIRRYVCFISISPRDGEGEIMAQYGD